MEDIIRTMLEGLGIPQGEARNAEILPAAKGFTIKFLSGFVLKYDSKHQVWIVRAPKKNDRKYALLTDAANALSKMYD